MPKSSRASLKNNLFEKILHPSQIFDELTEDNIAELVINLKANSAKGFKSLIIYDDVQNSLKNPSILRNLKLIIANQRHLKVVNLIMVQNYFALHKSLRELINNAILFKIGKSQMSKVYDELVEINLDKFDDVIDLVFDKPFEFLFINIGSQRLYKGFDEIIFDNV